ncbi:hypothetical protein KW787_02880, partial [Candidatus Pacearchaeota archaeon]|nr:hypothetical protein [Candidatus Pacearchaeota archaeon]
SDQIEKDVSATSSAIESTNQRINTIEANSQASGALGDKTLNTDAAKKSLAAEIRDKYKGQAIMMPKGSQWSITPGTQQTTDRVAVEEVLSDKNLDSMSYQEVRNIYMNLEREKSGGLSTGGLENAQSALGESAARINTNREIDARAQANKAARDLGYATPFYISGSGQTDRLTEVAPLSSLNTQERSKLGFTSSTHTATADVLPGASTSIPAGTYILGLKELSPGIYSVQEVVRKPDATTSGYTTMNPEEFSKNLKIGAIKPVNTATYHNKYSSPEVRFYDNEPYKGMPAVVPFDTVNGWYAGTKQTLPVFGGIGAFDANGRVSSFWVCNVGANGREQFEEQGYGDDICQLINLNTGQSLGVFPGLTDQEAKSLVERAVSALTEASQQAKNPNVRVGKETYKVGKPAVSIPTTQCQDFMSPKDCQLLFNVCDPVICPASRCNLGGAYQVSDVIQTGIIGGALLCLPNIKEGIAIPVCLSGINAGIESYVSILKSHRDCLQESLNTGKLVGICDQLYSVYLCEFFWRQVAPIANIILPKVVELAYGQGGTRGGGEYLTVMGAWQNTKNSIDYFTQSYASNSIKAFQIRSVEEAGSPFCRAFVSAKAPSSFKSLVQPDSPPQFNAYFDAIPFSSVTVPATSQYKVFYHIFAGNDAGIYYSVYLKNPPESSYYYSTPTIQIVSGFVAKGDYRSETRDFTAPEGYKELCVRINNEDRCGFKQVSTDFAVNYLRDQYVSNAATQKDIQTQDQCISGTGSANVGALLANTNPGAAISEVATPQIYSRGIIRICATNNPGSSTDPLRFVPVGICGDPKVTCWLDSKSVDNAITDSNIGVKNATLQELKPATKAYLEGQGEVFTDQQAVTELKSLEDAKGSLDITNSQAIGQLLGRIDFALSKLYLNNDKARLLFIRAGVFDRILAQFKQNVDSAKKAAGNSTTTTSTTKKEGITLSEPFDINKKIYIVDSGVQSKVYIQAGKVYLEQFLFDKELGRFDLNTKTITLTPGSEASIPGLYSKLNGAHLEGNSFVGSSAS